MEKFVVFLTFALTPVLMHYLKPVFNWVFNNPTLYTREVGYLPLVLIVFVVFIYVKIKSKK